MPSDKILDPSPFHSPIAATMVVPEATTSPKKGAGDTQNGAELLWDGALITGPVAGDVVIGQGVGLEVVWVGPSSDPTANSTVGWNVASDAVSDYVASAPLGLATYLGSDVEEFSPEGQPMTIHFYWVDSGAGGSAIKNVTASGSIEGMSFNVQTSFNVIAPSSFFVLHSNSTTGVSTVGFPELFLGDQDDGVNAYGDAQMPNFIGGTVGVFQIGTLFGLETAYGPPWTIRLLSYVGASDGYVPEPDGREGSLNHNVSGGSAQVDFVDNPYVNLVTFNHIYIDESFTDYLMFKPDGDGIWVPLRKLNWSWGGAATGDGNQFFGAGLFSPAPTVPSTIAGVEPQWSSNIPPSGLVWQQIVPSPG